MRGDDAEAAVIAASLLCGVVSLCKAAQMATGVTITKPLCAMRAIRLCRWIALLGRLVSHNNRRI